MREYIFILILFLMVPQIVWASASRDYDGTNDYLTASDDATLDIGTADFSVASWINTSNTDFEMVFCKGDDSSGVPCSGTNADEGYRLNKGNERASLYIADNSTGFVEVTNALGVDVVDGATGRFHGATKAVFLAVFVDQTANRAARRIVHARDTTGAPSTTSTPFALASWNSALPSPTGIIMPIRAPANSRTRVRSRICAPSFPFIPSL